MIDLHTHVLPGIDDGPRTIAESRAIARRALTDGVRTMVATPHVNERWPTRASAMEAALAALRADFAAQGIALELLPGAEVAVERLPKLAADELGRLTLAATGRYLLLEPPYTAWPPGLERVVWELCQEGVIPLLAHPERNTFAQRDLSRIEAAVQAGALVQVTAASLDGRGGRPARAAAEELLARGLVHVVASDAHVADVREAGLTGVAETVADDGLFRYLVEEAPAAVVAGDDVPAPPPWRRRGRRGIRARLGLG